VLEIWLKELFENRPTVSFVQFGDGHMLKDDLPALEAKIRELWDRTLRERAKRNPDALHELAVELNRLFDQQGRLVEKLRKRKPA